MKLSGLTLVAIGVALAGAAVISVGTALGLATFKGGHAPLHIGCTHHNHGPKWHENHGRVLGQPASRFKRLDQAAPADTDDIEGRGLTSGR